VQALLGIGFEVEQVLHGHGFTIRGAEQVPGAELVFGEVSFKLEGLDGHHTPD